MAITVRHDPPARTIANAAYTVGMGEWQRFQQEQQLKQQQQQLQRAQLAQQDLAQRRNLAAQQQNQLANRQDNALDRQLRVGLAGAEMHQNAANRLQSRGWDVEDNNRRFEEADEAQQRQIDFATEQQRSIAERMAEDDRRRRIDAGIKAGEFKYNDTQKRRISEIDTAIANLPTDKKLTEQDRAAAKQQLEVERNTIIDSPMPVMPDERPETPEQRAEGLRVWLTDPDGQQRAYRFVNRNGEEQLDLLVDPADSKNSAEALAAKQAEVREKAYKDYYNEIRKPDDSGRRMGVEEASRLANEHVRGLENFGSKYEFHSDDATGYGGYREVPQQATPPAQEVPQQPMPDPELPPPAPQEPPPAQPDFVPGGIAIDDGQPPLPPIPEAPQKIGAPQLRRPQSAREAYAEVYKAVPDNQKFAWKKPNSISEDTARGQLTMPSAIKLMAANGIVPPAGVFGPPAAPPPKYDTDAEVEEAIAKYGSGLVFVGPDGKTYVTP